MQVAGRYVGWTTPEAVVVYDHVAQAELYRLPRPVNGGLAAIQADGKVALGYEVGDGPPSQSMRGLGWASQSEPFLHELPVPPARQYSGLKLRNDMIVFERGSLSTGDLGYVSLAGGEGKILAPSVEFDTPFGADRLFDFNGRQVAWLDRTCAGARVRVALLSDLIMRPRAASTLRCGLRLASRPRVTRQGDLRLRVSCVGFTRECKVFGATLHVRRTYRIGEKRLRRGTRLSAKRRRIGGLSSVGRFKISPQTRRLLRRPGGVRLTLRVRMGDFEGTAIRRRATVTVR